ncbi:MAG TPA: mannose-1-phosphate guanylyltransferase [Syntrophales bacterium]|nr:mannose-1-phosphate guanylyltransferase [Syntrophales bacterium]HPI58433.1 mannose-1-phosphate guanylyltransferase [Syntrophales bacterium]HPN23778.1 mannose-1-phosphate guanylyltransferase [Syntrophales bacterium]HQM30151.1 mannose-1-phosphate guanylyltransferase [Syntrophales bacterium]
MESSELNLVATIMAGGTGTRFWPMSTKERPKQFLKLFGNRSLLQKSYDRIRDLLPVDRIIVLTNAAHVRMVIEQLPELPAGNVIGEPLKRDTAAAVGLAAALCRKRFGNPVILTLTADHLIEPVDLFQKTLLSAARKAAEEPVLYTFGIKPEHPATGYGYLEFGRRVFADDGIEHFELLRFKEKPDLETAKSYLSLRRFYWNSGMFVWTAETILREMRASLPHHHRCMTRAAASDGSPSWQKALEDAFHEVSAISIDYGVMEKAARVRAVAARFTWSDVGGWLSLEAFLSKDREGNAARGEIFTLDACGNLVFCEDTGEEVMMIGLRNLVIVRAGKKTLIMKKEKAEELKHLVRVLEEKEST